ncbi:aldo/keto reductase [Actinoplanes sp. TBRC 11911]|nr:aldo/keto reductase [Actinoplanes sp. TBRC 11911]
MRYRRLGRSGLVVSVVGIGTNDFGRKLDQGGVNEVVDAAIDTGITLFDTADTYGEPHGRSEELLGNALKGRREDVIVATKVGWPAGRLNGNDFDARGSRRYITRAVESSLRRLQTDYIDLYQFHRPDPATPIEETLAVLDDLVRAGKVRYLGNSNFSGWQIADADWTARTANMTPFVSAQNHYSLLFRGAEEEVLPACERFGLGQLPFRPLTSGLLSGKYQRGERPAAQDRMSRPQYTHWLDNADWDTIDRLTAFGEQRGHSLLDVAIAGLASRPAVSSVIAGATTKAQVQVNAAAAAWEFTADDSAALDAALNG